MNKEYSDGNSAVEKQQQRTEELFYKLDLNINFPIHVDKVKNLCAKHSELIDDFEVVKEMNKIMSSRFDEIIDRFPLTNEVNYLITHINEIYSDPEEILERKLKLISLSKIVVALDKHKDNIKPKSYEESVETEEVEEESIIDSDDEFGPPGSEEFGGHR
jgi:hypothetical protein